MTKGAITYAGERVDALDAQRTRAPRRDPGDGRPSLLRPSDRRGEPAHRRLHAARRPRAGSRRDLDKVYGYFPRLESGARALAGYTSGGEQQMTAIGRALMARPKMILLDEPSMGLAPQIVEEIFEIVAAAEPRSRRQLPARRAEHQHRAALRRLRLHPRERPRRAWTAPRPSLRANEDVKEFYLGLSAAGRKSYPRRQALPPPQALAGVSAAIADASEKDVARTALEIDPTAADDLESRPMLAITTHSKPATRSARAALMARCRSRSRTPSARGLFRALCCRTSIRRGDRSRARWPSCR